MHLKCSNLFLKRTDRPDYIVPRVILLDRSRLGHSLPYVLDFLNFDLDFLNGVQNHIGL